MPRRITPSQFRSEVRQAQQKQRRASEAYNRAARKYNSDVKRAVDDYNRKVRAHNTRVRGNRQRLQSEIARYNSSRNRTKYVVFSESVSSLRQSFSRIEMAADSGTWTGGDDLLDLTEGETANSVAVLNALLDESASAQAEDDLADLQTTSIQNELAEISPDLAARWDGALFALNPSNADAARHFCTSAREILTTILELKAPLDAIKATPDGYEQTASGGVSRRARIRFCLERRGTPDPSLEEFVEEDIEDALALFRDFNDGTHGHAGRFDLRELTAIKKRVEDVILFLHRITS